MSKELLNIVKNYNICGIVIGFPLLPNNELSPFCYEIYDLISKITCAPNGKDEMICTFWDERFTSYFILYQYQ